MAAVEIENPHIVVTEVVPKFTKDPVCGSELQIPGYTVWHNIDEVNYSDSPKGRGIIIYVIAELKVRPVYNIISVAVKEAVFVSIKLKEHGDRLLVGALYRSPNSTPENNASLCNLVKQLGPSAKYSHILLVGDFNYKSIDWVNGVVLRSYDGEKPFFESTQEAFLYQHVDQPTRRRGPQTEPSLIDLVFTNEENMVSSMKYLSPLGSSDHSVLTFNFHCYLESSCPANNSKFSYNNGNYSEIKKDLQLDWIKLENLEDIDLSYQLFLEEYNKVVNRHIPLVNKQKSSAHSKKKLLLIYMSNLKSELGNADGNDILKLEILKSLESIAIKETMLKS